MEKLSVYLRFNKGDTVSEIQGKINSALGNLEVRAVAYSVSATYKTTSGETCPAWIVWFDADLLITDCVDTDEFNILSAKRHEQIVSALQAAGLNTIS